MLARLGVRILSATPPDLTNLPASQEVDVVVLCSSVQPELQADVVRTINEKWKPRASILQIESISGSRLNGGAEFFADSAPEKWIEQTQKLLARNP